MRTRTVVREWVMKMGAVVRLEGYEIQVIEDLSTHPGFWT